MYVCEGGSRRQHRNGEGRERERRHFEIHASRWYEVKNVIVHNSPGVRWLGFLWS